MQPLYRPCENDVLLIPRLRQQVAEKAQCLFGGHGPLCQRLGLDFELIPMGQPTPSEAFTAAASNCVEPGNLTLNFTSLCSTVQSMPGGLEPDVERLLRG